MVMGEGSNGNLKMGPCVANHTLHTVCITAHTHWRHIILYYYAHMWRWHVEVVHRFHFLRLPIC